MALIHNEQTKLTAAWLNALATALIAAGGFAPFAAFLYRLTPAPADFAIVYGTAIGCFALGYGHM